ncbi:solute carrier family 22 member 7-like isoform X1 [Schistocerca serialis cubense]|uniref:solute carrier family 22 member 7-like isoform X1 n=1 Tax=Schistocerca serialis cubense TaxID=2023355 RepID=UPI00214E54EF|nr:solute carrier family 22 member 7-like isoform X1 [Schistocerca serialis cubense]
MEETFQNVKFEDIIDQIGGNGKFQQQHNIIFICLSSIFMAMVIYSKMLAITIPDHWCYVPGREEANVSTDIWKNMTIPRNGETYSKCLMYNDSDENNETIPCIYGWEYDDTWFSLTAASQENWVCDKAIYAHTSLSLTLLFSTVIGIAFFYIGDRFGRRKQYIFSTSLASICRGVLPFIVSVYPLFIAASAVAAGAAMPATESALAIGIELCGVKHRSANNFRSCLCFAFGFITIILLAWLLRNWIYFILITAVLSCIPLLFVRYLPESPRWLVAKGYPEDALKVLQKVASANGTALPNDTHTKLKCLSDQRTEKMGLKTLFVNRVLFKNTLLLIWDRSAAVFTMLTLLLSDKTFGGNPFVPFIGQASLHIPAISLSHYVGNKFGRRCSHLFIVLTAAIVSFLTVCSITVSSPQWVITTSSLFIQFCNQASLSLTNLQSMEIHPTCVRQTSVAMEYMLSNAISCVAPYVAYVGTEIELRYMFGILGTTMLFASLSISFLPESLNQKLPETIEDATAYGQRQKYWRLSQKKHCEIETANLRSPDPAS